MLVYRPPGLNQISVTRRRALGFPLDLGRLQWESVLRLPTQQEASMQFNSPCRKRAVFPNRDAFKVGVHKRRLLGPLQCRQAQSTQDGGYIEVHLLYMQVHNDQTLQDPGSLECARPPRNAIPP